MEDFNERVDRLSERALALLESRVLGEEENVSLKELLKVLSALQELKKLDGDYTSKNISVVLEGECVDYAG